MASDGRLLAGAQGGPGALDALPSPAQARVLDALAREVCRQAGRSLDEVERVAVGANGVDFQSEWQAQHRELCRLAGFQPRRTVLVNDGIAALWGAAGGPRSAIVQLGSALTSAYRSRPGGETLFDALDLARFYDLRREIVPVVGRMLDGRLERTSLADRVLRHLGIAEDEFGEALYRRAGVRARLLTVAPVISAAWQEGDPAAAEMVRLAVADLALLVRAIAGRLGRGPFACALGGGTLATLPPAFRDLAAAAIAEAAPDAIVSIPRLAPELGAAVLAGHEAGLDESRLFEALADPVAA